MRIFLIFRIQKSNQNILKSGIWIDIDDPIPYCQHDAFLPIRAKGRNIGKTEWGKYEIKNVS